MGGGRGGDMPPTLKYTGTSYVLVPPTYNIVPAPLVREMIDTDLFMDRDRDR